MRKFAIVMAVLLLMTSAAWAADSKAYVGATVGTADMGPDDDTSWKFVGGYNFNRFFGVEGSYRDLGGSSATVATTTVSMDASSLDVFGVGTVPLGEKFDFFGKLGMARVEVDASVTDPLVGTVSASDSENEMAMGAGINYKIGKTLSIRAEYETFDTTESVDVISAGAIWRF